jgi:hypothetical protein
VLPSGRQTTQRCGSFDPDASVSVGAVLSVRAFHSKLSYAARFCNGRPPEKIHSKTEDSTMEARQSPSKTVSLFVIAFAISWLLWLPQVLDSNDLVRFPEFVGILGMFAPFGPFVAALWLTGRQGGREAVKRLLKQGWSLD